MYNSYYILLLNCTVEYMIPRFSPRSPVPTITWRKINGNIPKKARLRKSQAVLEIPNIQLEDSGTYECKAENPRGGTAFKGHLQVYSESGHSVIFYFWSSIKHYIGARVLMCCIPGIAAWTLHSQQQIHPFYTYAILRRPANVPCIIHDII